MKTFLILILTCASLWAGNVLTYAPDGTVTGYLRSVNTPDYEGQTNVLINPTLPEGWGGRLDFWKVVDGAITELSQAEKDAITSAEAAAVKAAKIEAAKAPMTADVSEAIILRAVVAVLLDEINTLRAREGLPARTMTQAKAAILSKVDELEAQ